MGNRLQKWSLGLLAITLGGCVSIQGSELTLLVPSFSVANGEASWLFNSSSNYTQTGSFLDWDGTSAKVGTVVYGLESVAACNAGTLINTECSDEGDTFMNVQLQSGQTSGTYNSPIFDAGDTISWTGHQVSPEFPLALPLPDSGGSDTGYITGNFSMTNNLALLHGDALATLQTDDDSGNTNHATCSAGQCPSVVAGLLDSALDFDGTKRVLHPADMVRFDQSTTITFWAKHSMSGSNPRVLEAGSGPNSFKVYIGASGSYCGQLLVGAGNLLRCTSTPANDGQWHHVAVRLTISGVNAELSVYLDGNHLNTTTNNSWTYGAITAGSQLAWGGASTASGEYIGQLDEMAVFERAISAGEIRNIYLRGSRENRWQVQFCPTNACAGTFVGPDGTGGTWFTEDDRTVSGFPFFGSPSSQYLQFRLEQDRMDTADPSALFNNLSFEPAHYYANYQSVENQDTTAFSEMTSFTATFTTDSNAEAGFQLSNDGTNWYYHNGANWVSAAALSNSNTATEVNTDIATFDDDVGTGNIFFRAVFQSVGGTQVIGLEQVAIGFN